MLAQTTPARSRPATHIAREPFSVHTPADSPYGPEDLAATVYTRLGINPKDEIHTPDGRPVALVNNGKVIRELV